MSFQFPPIKAKTHQLRWVFQLGSRDSNPKFHVQSVTCYRYTTPQGDGYFTTNFKNIRKKVPLFWVTNFFFF